MPIISSTGICWVFGVWMERLEESTLRVWTPVWCQWPRKCFSSARQKALRLRKDGSALGKTGMTDGETPNYKVWKTDEKWRLISLKERKLQRKLLGAFNSNSNDNLLLSHYCMPYTHFLESLQLPCKSVFTVSILQTRRPRVRENGTLSAHKSLSLCHCLPPRVDCCHRMQNKPVSFWVWGI